MSRPPSILQHIWDSLTDEARAVIGAALAELAERLADAEQQIQELRARLDRNPTNGSKPPSTDPIGVKRKPQRPAVAETPRRAERSTFLRTVAWLRPMIRSSLERGSVCACPKTATTRGELLRLWDCLRMRTRVEGLETTNNAAERALRHAVIW